LRRDCHQVGTEKALADDNLIGRDKVSEAIKRYGINVDKADPVAV
jgi:pyruvate dehydrogenase E1 component